MPGLASAETQKRSGRGLSKPKSFTTLGRVAQWVTASQWKIRWMGQQNPPVDRCFICFIMFYPIIYRVSTRFNHPSIGGSGDGHHGHSITGVRWSNINESIDNSSMGQVLLMLLLDTVTAHTKGTKRWPWKIGWP
jgi:hypothetical protein